MSSKANPHAWFALWILFGINTMNFYDRQIIAAVTEPVRQEYGLSDSQLGLLTTAFTLLYAVIGVPLGRLADQWTRTRLLSIGVAVWSLLTFSSGLAWNYWSLFLTRLGVGVGEASCAPAANSLIGDLYPARQRARALAVFMLGLPLGVFLSFWLSGVIANSWGWRAAFYFAGFPGLALAFLVLFVREPERGAAEEHWGFESKGEVSPYWAVLSIPTIWWIIVSGALHNFNMYALNSFFTAFLSRYHGISLRQATTVSAVVLGAVGIVGLLGGGWAADRARQAQTNGRLLLGAAAVFLSSPFLYFALQRPKGDMFGLMLLMGTGFLLMFVYYATVYAAIQDVIEPKLRGTAMALYFFAMYVLGASLGPLGTGMLSDYYAKRAMLEAGAGVMTEQFRATGLHSAMYLTPVLSLLVGSVLWAGARSMKTMPVSPSAHQSATAAK